MVAEDRQRMRRQGAGGNVEDGRRQFAGDLVHVRDHQQQALRGREGRRQRAGLQRAMHGTGGTAFGLQFDDFRNAAPDIGLALRRPFVGQFAHTGRRGDRVNGDHFGNAEGHVCDGFVTVDGEHVFHDLILVVRLRPLESWQPENAPGKPGYAGCCNAAHAFYARKRRRVRPLR